MTDEGVFYYILICIPGQPRCEVCPLVGVCQAQRLRGKKQRFPACYNERSTGRANHGVCDESRGVYLLHQRPEKGLLTASYYAIERKNKNEQKNERKILRLFFVRFLLKWYRRKFVYYQEAHCERIKEFGI